MDPPIFLISLPGNANDSSGYYAPTPHLTSLTPLRRLLDRGYLASHVWFIRPDWAHPLGSRMTAPRLSSRSPTRELFFPERGPPDEALTG